MKKIIRLEKGIYDRGSLDLAHGFVAAAEGGVCDVAQDRGGKTAYGISTALAREMIAAARGRALLRKLGLDTADAGKIIQAMTPEKARDIMAGWFWEPNSCDRLHPLNALLVYDASVNHGPKTGALLAQRAYNDWRAGNPACERLAEDGIIGPKTIAALAAKRKGLEELYAARRLDYYAAIIRRNGSQKVFEKGWRNRVRNLLNYILAWYAPDRLEIARA